MITAQVPDLPHEMLVYKTRLGAQVCADSRDVLRLLPEESVDLIVTSPPFALLRPKTYGNRDQSDYVKWLGEFGELALRVLKPSGSLVLDLGGAYERGRPVRSLYNFRVLIDFCDRIGYRLAQEFFWHNPAKLPSPIEWVNVRKLRVKDAVNTVWWLSKTDNPKADVTRVLIPYSESMRSLIKDPQKLHRPRKRPSGHRISSSFARENSGAIPSNLLRIANTESNSHYLRTCAMLGKDSHPARFPEALPRFFIRFLTDPGDLVLDIFSGSNTTGRVAEGLGRRWISVEIDRNYAALSAVRFMKDWGKEEILRAMEEIESGRAIDLDEFHRQPYPSILQKL